MRLDLRELPREHRYKLMTAAITPRPIAWVSTRSAAGADNLAPYSFFNMMGDDPAIIVLGLMRRADGRLKDTAANIAATSEFVVNLVREADAAAMNATCFDLPPGESEILAAGVATKPSDVVGPPRVASAPVSFECRRLQAIDFPSGQSVVIGEVLVAHVDDAFVLDPGRLHLDTAAMNLLARMHGANWYARQSDLFQMDRPTSPPMPGLSPEPSAR
uniref:Flavin reductase like domain-containing protein n=1 Tax=Caulobacter sp. (strain K31) TaxID=366602 RepID=B0T9J2_CAUSK